MTIKHIVLCGGGPVGLVSYGAIKKLMNNNIIIYENIKSIYSTSIGCFIALIFILNLKLEWIDDFLIKRPWENLINFSSIDYFNLFFTKGLCDENFFINVLKPLFLAADIPITITLKEFYEINKIDWHIFTCNLNKFSKVDLNYKTFPNLTVIEAISMSSSIPIMIKPPYYNGEYYLDGGLCCNCPLYDCYYNEKCSKNEIIVFINDKSSSSTYLYNNIENDIQNDYNKNDTSYNNLNENTNIFSFIIYIIRTIFKKIMIIENNTLITIKNTINVSITPYSFDINLWSYIFSNKEERKKLIELGELLGSDFISSLENNDISFNLTNNDISFNLTNNDISFNLTNNDISFENIIIKILSE